MKEVACFIHIRASQGRDVSEICNHPQLAVSSRLVHVVDYNVHLGIRLLNQNTLDTSEGRHRASISNLSNGASEEMVEA